jgi:hypothetical protein
MYQQQKQRRRSKNRLTRTFNVLFHRSPGFTEEKQQMSRKHMLPLDSELVLRENIAGAM